MKRISWLCFDYKSKRKIEFSGSKVIIMEKVQFKQKLVSNALEIIKTKGEPNALYDLSWIKSLIGVKQYSPALDFEATLLDERLAKEYPTISSLFNSFSSIPVEKWLLQMIMNHL